MKTGFVATGHYRPITTARASMSIPRHRGFIVAWRILLVTLHSYVHRSRPEAITFYIDSE